MVTIEIDEDVFSYLKALAEPFIDTPNTVLRRIIFPEPKHNYGSSTKVQSSPSLIEGLASSSEVFTNSFLQNRYGENFRTKTPFRTMYESEKHLVYFQNFNKAGTINLWYRLSESALNTLRKTPKRASVCFTNASEKTIIEIPMKDIDKQISKSGWKKDFLEVNIDPMSLRWRELDWHIEQYLVKTTA